MKMTLILILLAIYLSMIFAKEIGYECEKPMYCKYISSIGSMKTSCQCNICEQVLDDKIDNYLLLSGIGVQFCDSNE